MTGKWPRVAGGGSSLRLHVCRSEKHSKSECAQQRRIQRHVRETPLVSQLHQDTNMCVHPPPLPPPSQSRACKSVCATRVARPSCASSISGLNYKALSVLSASSISSPCQTNGCWRRFPGLEPQLLPGPPWLMESSPPIQAASAVPLDVDGNPSSAPTTTSLPLKP